MSYQPPFEITPKIVNQISAIAEQVGRLNTQGLKASPQLRKQNRIKTIQSTLAIEGNTLSSAQVTAILDGKRVLGQLREIQAVQGALRAYETLPNRNPTNVKDLLAAHHQMMGEMLIDLGDFVKGVSAFKRRPSCSYGSACQTSSLFDGGFNGLAEKCGRSCLG